jgi:hypothetical protein
MRRGGEGAASPCFSTARAMARILLFPRHRVCHAGIAMNRLAGVVVAAFLLPAAHAQAPAKAEADGARPAAAEDAAQPKKRRLKFKSDKACTCTSALGEADIEVAEKKAAPDPQPRRNEK